MKATRRNEAPAQERPPQPGRTGAVILAIVVHAIFFALIVFGVSWQSRPEAPLMAELWSKLPSAPAKPPETAPAPPEPVKAPPEPVKPPPEPVKPPPEPAKPVEPPKPDPEIARKAEREKKEQQKREELQREKERKEKAEREKKEQDAKKKKEEDARKKKEEDTRRKEEERVQKEIQEARAAAASQRQLEIDKWMQGIRDKIRGKANIPDTVVGHPTVQVSIRILPTGEVLDVTITKPSGNPTYDAAIERAIRSASPLRVPPPDSELFSVFRNPTLNITHDR